MLIGLAVAAEAEAEAKDLRSAVVAQASFWWRGRALLVEHGGIGVRVIRCVPQQRRLTAKTCPFVEQRYEYLLL